MQGLSTEEEDSQFTYNFGWKQENHIALTPPGAVPKQEKYDALTPSVQCLN